MFDTDKLNILYGVQATGNGHITRSREVITALKQRGHKLQVIVSGRPEKDLWGMQAFEPFQVMEGLTFRTHQGKVQKMASVMNARPLKMLRDIKGFNADSIDLVISDYEPISARIAKKNHIPSMGIGHQYAFDYKIPRASFTPITRTFMKKFAPVDLSIGLHWYHFNSPILPPIIPPLTGNAGPVMKKILVYLPFEDPDLLLKTLSQVDGLDFVFYTNVIDPCEYENVTICPLSINDFHEDLLSAEGVICNSGFELPSEALSIGKKILVKPLLGQPEQESNAKALQELEIGSIARWLTVTEIENWYVNQTSKRINFPPVVTNLIDWVESGQWDLASLDTLSRYLWNQTNVEALDLASIPLQVDANHLGFSQI